MVEMIMILDIKNKIERSESQSQLRSKLVSSSRSRQGSRSHSGQGQRGDITFQIQNDLTETNYGGGMGPIWFGRGCPVQD